MKTIIPGSKGAAASAAKRRWDVDDHGRSQARQHSNSDVHAHGADRRWCGSLRRHAEVDLGDQKPDRSRRLTLSGRNVWQRTEADRRCSAILT